MKVWEKAKQYYQKYQKWFIRFIFIVVVFIWLLPPVIGKTLPVEKSISVTMGVILFFMFIMLDHLLSIKEPDKIEVYPNEHGVGERIRSYIAEEAPHHVKMIEYSTGSIRQSWLQNLDGVRDVRIDLLMRHPASTTDYQRKFRICPAIVELSRRFGSTSNFNVVCYSSPAGLRGRNFDDRFLVVGWYTYYLDPTRLVDGKPELRVVGDGNALVASYANSEKGAFLKNMFNRVFDDLWRNGSPLEEVCGAYPWCDDCMGKPPADWLKKTNPRNAAN
ncbi:MAG: hypothetical protein ACM3MK_06565 [Chitinophagales bacterium]